MLLQSPLFFHIFRSQGCDDTAEPCFFVCESCDACRALFVFFQCVLRVAMMLQSPFIFTPRVAMLMQSPLLHCYSAMRVAMLLQSPLCRILRVAMLAELSHFINVQPTLRDAMLCRALFVSCLRVALPAEPSLFMNIQHMSTSHHPPTYVMTTTRSTNQCRKARAQRISRMRQACKIPHARPLPALTCAVCTA